MEDIQILVFDEDYLGLADSFKVSPNLCRNPVYYEMYLSRQALDDQKNGKCVTHIIARINSSGQADKIIGYITLCASSLNIRNNKDDFGSHSAIKIEYIAIDTHFERHGFGTILLKYAITEIADELRQKYVGVKYIVTCADPDAVRFYSNYGFELCDDKYDVSNNSQNVNMYWELPDNEHD